MEKYQKVPMGGGYLALTRSPARRRYANERTKQTEIRANYIGDVFTLIGRGRPFHGTG